MQGTFGYELDLTKLSDLELAVIKNQITKYKKLRPIIQFGDLYRLKDNDNEQAWMYLYQKQVLVSYVQILAKPNTVPKGLKVNTKYCLLEDNQVYDGSVLMNIGLPLEKVKEDFYSKQWYLKEINEDE